MKRKKMVRRFCRMCENFFQTRLKEGEALCFDCALAQITNGRPPEEGDFNTASIISGTFTEEEEGWLRDDLRAVESGGGSRYHEICDTPTVDEQYFQYLIDKYES